MPTLVANLVLLPAAVIALLIADWRLGLVVFAIVPPALVLTRWFQRASHVALVETRNRIAVVTAQIAESVSGMTIVQAFNRERRFQEQFDELNAANRTQNVYTQKIFSIFFPSIEFLGMVATGAVLYTGATLLSHHTLTIGTLITALYLLQLVFQPLQELSDVYGQLQSGAAAMVKIAAILDEEPEIRERKNARVLPRIEGDLAIDHVVFAYGKEPVLHGIDDLGAGRAAASRSSASPAAASRRSRGSSAASTTPTRAPCASTASTCATSRCARTAASSASCCRIRSSSAARSRRTSASASPTRPTPRSRRPRPPSASTASPRASAAGSTTRCARAAPASRPASAS